MSKKTYNPDEATLGLVFEEGTATEQNGPVTVLGLTFANNDERRESVPNCAANCPNCAT